MKRIAHVGLFVLVLACDRQKPLTAPVPPTAPDSAGAGTDAGTPPGYAGCGADRSAAGTLLDASATRLYSVSPDGEAVLADHGPEFAYPPSANLFLATRREVTQVGPAGPVVSGAFSNDGRAIKFSVAPPLDFGDLRLARSDGSGARVLTQNPLYSWAAGRWFYFTDKTDTTLSLFRLEAPDGAPEAPGTWPVAPEITGRT